MVEARFEVEVTEDTCREFAALSGDYNPLHVDPVLAATTEFGRPVLHGAYSAALISRLAGMHLPGERCLLHGLRLRFVRPVVPPARLIVSGRLASGTPESGRVDVTILDAADGTLRVSGSYDFDLHNVSASLAPSARPLPAVVDRDRPILVTGALGAIGRALCDRLGREAVGIARRTSDTVITVERIEDIASALPSFPIGGILHAAWPAPDNRRLVDVEDPAATVEHHVAGPLRQIMALARLLAERGLEGAPLVLIGSTFASPGRHAFRMPLYSAAKSLLPTLVKTLALELAASRQRCFGVVFDVVDGGMNAAMAARTRLGHEDRSPFGTLISPDAAAGQIEWLLGNSSTFLSGAMIDLSGGALP